MNFEELSCNGISSVTCTESILFIGHIGPNSRISVYRLNETTQGKQSRYLGALGPIYGTVNELILNDNRSTLLAATSCGYLYAWDVTEASLGKLEANTYNPIFGDGYVPHAERVQPVSSVQPACYGDVGSVEFMQDGRTVVAAGIWPTLNLHFFDSLTGNKLAHTPDLLKPPNSTHSPPHQQADLPPDSPPESLTHQQAGSQQAGSQQVGSLQADELYCSTAQQQVGSHSSYRTRDSPAQPTYVNCIKYDKQEMSFGDQTGHWLAVGIDGGQLALIFISNQTFDLITQARARPIEIEFKPILHKLAGGIGKGAKRPIRSDVKSVAFKHRSVNSTNLTILLGLGDGNVHCLVFQGVELGLAKQASYGHCKGSGKGSLRKLLSLRDPLTQTPYVIAICHFEVDSSFLRSGGIDEEASTDATPSKAKNREEADFERSVSTRSSKSSRLAEDPQITAELSQLTKYEVTYQCLVNNLSSNIVTIGNNVDFIVDLCASPEKGDFVVFATIGGEVYVCERAEGGWSQQYRLPLDCGPAVS